MRMICLALLGASVTFAHASMAADEDPLEHPFLPKHDAIVVINAKTNATATEIILPCFARKLSGTKLEVHTTHGWGWVERSHMMTPKEAEKYLQAHNKEAYGLYLRSIFHMYNEQKDKALEDLNAAIKIDPKFAPAYCQRGHVHAMKQQYAKALPDFQEAVKLDPKDLLAANDQAWFRATCPDEKYRDGKQAVAEATRVCEATGYKHEEFLDTLAAACAESGDFKSAVKWASKAAEIDPKNEDFSEHVKLYKANKPLRDDPM